MASKRRAAWEVFAAAATAAHLGRARQERGDAVQEGLDANVTKGRAEEDRKEGARNGRSAHGRRELVARHRRLLDKERHRGVVRLCDGLDELLSPRFCRVTQIGRHRSLCDLLATSCLAVQSGRVRARRS